MNQGTINLFIGLGFSVLGWFAREMWSAVKMLKEDLATLREEIALHYIRKDDFREVMREVTQKLDRIFEKLDTKPDK